MSACGGIVAAPEPERSRRDGGEFKPRRLKKDTANSGPEDTSAEAIAQERTKKNLWDLREEEQGRLGVREIGKAKPAK